MMTSYEFQSGVTREERVWAAASHVAAGLLLILGAIIAFAIWATQKEKSPYVAFQALQAAIYNIAITIINFFASICIMGFMAVSMTNLLDTRLLDTNMEMLNNTISKFIFGQFAIYGLILVGIFAFSMYALVGAVMTLQGQHFRYIILGQALERDLKRNR